MTTMLRVSGAGGRVALTVVPPQGQGDPVTVDMPAADLLDALLESSPDFTNAVAVRVRGIIATTLTRNSELGIPTN